MKSPNELLVVSLSAMLFTVLWPQLTSANPGFQDGCATCHSDIADRGPDHDTHAELSNSDCGSCHDGGTGPGRNNPPLANCVRCHGRDADSGGDNISSGLGRGLRQHHVTAGVADCGNCHADATGPAGVGEDLLPSFYASVDNLVGLDSCDGSEENFSSNSVSLDNDGDGLTDSADPDCAPVVFLDIEALPNVAGGAAVDVAVLVADLEAPSIDVYVRDGGTGGRISQMSVLDNAWQAIDLAVMSDSGANALVGVLAQKSNGVINVAVHRADDGSFVRQIAFFNQNWVPSALAYVADAAGPGESAFAVVAKNSLDNRISVQLRRISDGSLIKTLLFFRDIWDEIDLGAIADISGNNHPEILVVGQSDVGRIVAVVMDADSGQVINRISYFGAASTPKAITEIASIGGSAAPELPLLAAKGNGRNTVQSRDAVTDAVISSVYFLNSFWNSMDIGGLGDVNGNTSADMSVFARHITKGTIQGDVRDALTGDLIQRVKFLGPLWKPYAFAVLDDITGNGVQELGVVARNGNGDIKVQLRDASTGVTVKTINIP